MLWSEREIVSKWGTAEDRLELMGTDNNNSQHLEYRKNALDSRPMRVLHVVEYLGLAGMEYGVIKQVNRLDPNIFSPMICCLRHQVEATVPLINSTIPIFELKKNQGRDLRVISSLATLLRNQRVDIVHSHNWPTFFYTIMAALLARTPIIIHGVHGREGKEVSRRQQLVQRLMGNFVSCFVTVSSSLEKEIRSIWKVRPENISTVSNGVDLKKYAQTFPLEPIRKELQMKMEGLVILSVGGLRPVKDQETLIRAVAKVRHTLPQVYLLIVGTDHGSGVLHKLQELVEKLNIQEHVHFLGVRHDIPQLMQLCNVYVNTSIFEGMSNTILEAMAAGRPVIATRVGGNPELVKDKITGYLIEPKSVESLANRLNELLMDPELAEAMGSAGRKGAEQNHSMSTMINRYQALYQEMWFREKQKSNSFNENAKKLIAQGLRCTGLTILKRLTSPGALHILTYHRVLPIQQSVCYPFQGMVMPRDAFEAQMAYLAESYVVLSFAQGIERLQNGNLPKKSVVVTFDDGYRDNYEFALPILKKYEIPATFFVVTDAVEQRIRLWWDEVAEAIRLLSLREPLTKEEREPLPSWVCDTLNKLSEKNKHQNVADELVHAMNDVSLRDRMMIRESLLHLVHNDMSVIQDLMLTWGQVEEMYLSGMSFQAHTRTHAFIDELPEDEARKEVQDCVSSLKSKLNTSIQYFSYPRGRYSEALQPLLENEGIHAAVTTDQGMNHSGTNLFQLKRLDAGYCRTSTRFNSSIFNAELQGWFSLLRRR